MALQKTTYVERVLIVLNPDGTVKGAHQESIETVADGEQVLSVRQLPAAVLTAQTLAVAVPSAAAALAGVAARDATIAELRAKVAQTQTELEHSQTELEQALASGRATASAGSVTLAQARVAIRRAGLFDAVDAAVRVAGGEALDAWEYSNTVSRNSTLVASLSSALSLTDDQVDALFTAAAAIEF